MAGGAAKGKKRQKEQRDGEKATASAGEDQGGSSEQGQVLFPPSFSVSEIKNKQRRHFMFLRWKQQQRKEKLAIKKKRKKEREALGDKVKGKD